MAGAFPGALESLYDKRGFLGTFAQPTVLYMTARALLYDVRWVRYSQWVPVLVACGVMRTRPVEQGHQVREGECGFAATHNGPDPAPLLPSSASFSQAPSSSWGHQNQNCPSK